MFELNKKNMIKIGGLIVFSGIVLFIAVNTNEAKTLLNFIVTVLSPFIYGFCIAFILNLVMKPIDRLFKWYAEKKNRPYSPKKHRVFSIVIALLMLLLLIGLTVGLIIPNIKNTVISFYKQMPTLWANIEQLLDDIKTKYPKIAEYITTFEANIDTYYDKALTGLKNNLSNIAGTALSTIKSASGVAVNVFIGLMIAFGVLIKKEELLKEFRLLLRKLCPENAYRKTVTLLKLFNTKFQIYFKYQFLQAVITGGATLVVMLIARMPYAVSISLLITVTQLIPIVGAIVGTVVSALLIAAISPVKAIIFVVLSIVIQQFVEKVINPHLMGKELEMPGILTFLAIMIGGKQFGLIGLIVSVPIVSVCYDLYTQQLRPKLKNKKNKE